MNVSSSKKILAPLAVLLAAGALAVGSGATFTSASSNTISSVTAGSLKHTNSKAESAVFQATNIKPGAVVKGSVVITNTGTLPANFSLTETASVNGFTGSNLTMVITNKTDNKQVWTGTFGALEDGSKVELGEFAAGAAKEYEWVVTLDSSTPNADQGASAEAAYSWDAVQTSN